MNKDLNPLLSTKGKKSLSKVEYEGLNRFVKRKLAQQNFKKILIDQIERKQTQIMKQKIKLAKEKAAGSPSPLRKALAPSKTIKAICVEGNQAKFQVKSSASTFLRNRSSLNVQLKAHINANHGYPFRQSDNTQSTIVVHRHRGVSRGSTSLSMNTQDFAMLRQNVSLPLLSE